MEGKVSRAVCQLVFVYAGQAIQTSLDAFQPYIPAFSLLSMYLQMIFVVLLPFPLYILHGVGFGVRSSAAFPWVGECNREITEAKLR